MKKIAYIMVAFLFVQCSSGDKKSDASSDSSAEATPGLTVDPDEVDQGDHTGMDEDRPEGALLNVAAAKMTFEYTGKWTGTETVWFDQYGIRCVMEQDIQYSPRNHYRGRYSWTGSKVGSLMCKYSEYGEEINECQDAYIRPKDTELSMFAHGDTLQLSYGYDRVGTKTVVGKEAEGWKSRNGNITGYVWEGIDMHYDNDGVIRTCTSFEVIDKIPAKAFEVPEGCTKK